MGHQIVSIHLTSVNMVKNVEQNDEDCKGDTIYHNWKGFVLESLQVWI